MKNKSLKMLFSLTLLFLGVTLMSACGSRKESILLGEGDWDSSAFHNQVAKFIVENGYGVDVDIVLADTAVKVVSLRAGNMDVALEIWSQNVTTYDQDIASGQYEEVSVNFADNEQGLYIPRYLQETYPDLQTVEDLLDYAHLFPNPEGGDKGIIYGGPEGWGATDFLHKKVELYGLTDVYTFKPIDSNATLSATLAAAYSRQEPWVGYNWEPTWIMGLYDMVLLEDSAYNEEDFAIGKGAFASVDVTVVVRSGFGEDYKELYEFFSQYHTSSELTSEALLYMQQNSAEADEAAIWFLTNHVDLWSTWVTEEAKTKILNALGL